MLVRKLISGTESQTLLGELARVTERWPGYTVERIDDATLAIDSDELRGSERQLLEDALSAANPDWRTHVQLLED